MVASKAFFFLLFYCCCFASSQPADLLPVAPIGNGQASAEPLLSFSPSTALWSSTACAFLYLAGIYMWSLGGVLSETDRNNPRIMVARFVGTNAACCLVLFLLWLTAVLQELEREREEDYTTGRVESLYVTLWCELTVTLGCCMCESNIKPHVYSGMFATIGKTVCLLCCLYLGAAVQYSVLVMYQARSVALACDRADSQLLVESEEKETCNSDLAHSKNDTSGSTLSDSSSVLRTAHALSVVDVLPVPSWSLLRTSVLAPLTEEFMFRSCCCTILTAGNLSSTTVVLVSASIFSLVHLHHGLHLHKDKDNSTSTCSTHDNRKKRYRSRIARSTENCVMAMRRVIIQAYCDLIIFMFDNGPRLIMEQCLHTFAFGLLSGYLFVTTRQLSSAWAAHVFCNLTGIPDLTWVTGKPHVMSRITKSLRDLFYGTLPRDVCPVCSQILCRSYSNIGDMHADGVPLSVSSIQYCNTVCFYEFFFTSYLIGFLLFGGMLYFRVFDINM
eukprot:GHVQ01015388.1.p1 GENE.GHVQ01015388.1~~GHVQ01015388.1.p1  ORF type:complete len:501 (+),score=48.90 GHVQ01015388.1:192-1694(+)